MHTREINVFLTTKHRDGLAFLPTMRSHDACDNTAKKKKNTTSMAKANDNGVWNDSPGASPDQDNPRNPDSFRNTDLWNPDLLFQVQF